MQQQRLQAIQQQRQQQLMAQQMYQMQPGGVPMGQNGFMHPQQMAQFQAMQARQMAARQQQQQHQVCRLQSSLPRALTLTSTQNPQVRPRHVGAKRAPDPRVSGEQDNARLTRSTVGNDGRSTTDVATATASTSAKPTAHGPGAAP